jgi:hypothetical protein
LISFDQGNQNRSGNSQVISHFEGGSFIPWFNLVDKINLGWSSDINLGPESMLLHNVSGSIISGVNLSGLV